MKPSGCISSLPEADLWFRLVAAFCQRLSGFSYIVPSLYRLEMVIDGSRGPACARGRAAIDAKDGNLRSSVVDTPSIGARLLVRRLFTASVPV
jgi:hypothetical protein